MQFYVHERQKVCKLLPKFAHPGEAVFDFQFSEGGFEKKGGATRSY